MHQPDSMCEEAPVPRWGFFYFHNRKFIFEGVDIGLIAQLMFSMRFLVQWVATEKARA